MITWDGKKDGRRSCPITLPITQRLSGEGKWRGGKENKVIPEPLKKGGGGGCVGGVGGVWGVFTW